MVGSQVRRLAPALDRDLVDLAVGDHARRASRRTSTDRLAPDVGEVTRRADAVQPHRRAAAGGAWRSRRPASVRDRIAGGHRVGPGGSRPARSCPAGRRRCGPARTGTRAPSWCRSSPTTDPSGGPVGSSSPALSGPLSSDLSLERIDQVGTGVSDRVRLVPVVGVGHPPPQVGLEADVDERRDVAPVLEQLVVPVGEPVEQSRVVRAEAGEEREVLRPSEDVHRVELDHAEPVDHLRQVATVDLGRSRPALARRPGGPAGC